MEACKAGFIYTVEHLGRGGEVLSVEQAQNIIPTAGLNYILGATLTGQTQFTAWYLGLYSNNYTPIAADTASTFIGNAGENQAYTGTERQTITFPAVSNGSVSTLSDPNIFNFTSSQTIRGAFIATTPAWGGTTGLIISALLFPSPKNVTSGESLKVPVGFTLISG